MYLQNMQFHGGRRTPTVHWIGIIGASAPDRAPNIAPTTVATSWAVHSHIPARAASVHKRRQRLIFLAPARRAEGGEPRNLPVQTRRMQPAGYPARKGASHEATAQMITITQHADLAAPV